MKEEIADLIKEKGLLLEKEVYDLVESLNNVAVARVLLEQLEKSTEQKFITKSVLSKNVSSIRGVVGNLPGESKQRIERIFINFGLSFEITRETAGDSGTSEENQEKRTKYVVLSAETLPEKKLEVKDFTGNFRARFQQLQKILMQRAELQNNLVSLNKISSDRTSLSIIGIVSEKHITKNKNLIIRLEDLTGEVKVLIKYDNKALFEKSEELQLDDVIGIRASGNRDILFVHDIFFPDAFLHSKTKFSEDVSIAFISDLHCGSNKHLGKSFERFLGWLNSEDETAKKLRYLFFVGDNVDGVGIFPGQEDVLDLKSMSEQYNQLAYYLKRIPKAITMFMCPGQHDAARVAEPQPLISRKYASELYSIENLVLVTNPAMIKLFEDDKEFKVLMYHGGSIHTFINEIKELRLMKAHKCPAKAVRYMLKKRHLAPMYGLSNQIIYIPNAEKDALVISEVPNVLCTGEVHRLDIERYNGVMIITGSCWQSQTPFEEKVGNEPDPCKVPVLNLKTNELKVFDFTDSQEMAEYA